MEEDLAVLDACEAVAQVDAPFADRFDFRAHEHDARFERLEQMKVVIRLAVFSDVGLRQLALGFFLQADLASRAASTTASTMLPASAMPLPAMSNAVP